MQHSTVCRRQTYGTQRPRCSMPRSMRRATQGNVLTFPDTTRVYIDVGAHEKAFFRARRDGDMQHTTYDMQHTTHNREHTACNMQHASVHTTTVQRACRQRQPKIDPLSTSAPYAIGCMAVL